MLFTQPLWLITGHTVSPRAPKAPCTSPISVYIAAAERLGRRQGKSGHLHRPPVPADAPQSYRDAQDYAAAAAVTAGCGVGG